MLLFMFTRELDCFDIGVYFLIMEIPSFDVGQDIPPLIDPIMGNEPTRGFRQPGHCKKEDQNEEELKGEWKTPGYGARKEGKSVCYPVGEGEARNVKDHLDHNQLATP